MFGLQTATGGTKVILGKLLMVAVTVLDVPEQPLASVTVTE